MTDLLNKLTYREKYYDTYKNIHEIGNICTPYFCVLRVIFLGSVHLYEIFIF